MSFVQRSPDPHLVHSRRAVKHVVQVDSGSRIPPVRSSSTYGSDISEIHHYNSEGTRSGIERFLIDPAVERERRKEAPDFARVAEEQRRAEERARREETERRRVHRERIIRRESELQKELKAREERELEIRLHQREEAASRREDREEIPRRRRVHLRMQSEQERMKLSERDRKTSISEPRQHRLQRSHSSGVPALPVEEPRSFFSRFSSLLTSAPAEKATTTPQLDVAPRDDAVPKVEKVEAQPKSTQDASVDLEGYFLQPAEDSQIQKGVIAISDSIDQHVFNHYGNRATNPPSDIFLRIVQMDNEELRLPKILIDQESFRLAAIRRLIAGAMIREIAIEGDPNTTFLPKEIVALLQMAPAHGAEKFRFAASSAFCRLAANLLRLGQSGASTAYSESQRSRVKMASDRLHKGLSVIANKDSQEAARRDQLEAIMTKAAEIGILLLLQPATHQFEWSTQLSTGSSFDEQGRIKSRPGPFVIFPALIRTGDSTGRKLRRGQMVCKPEYLDEDDMTEDSMI
ncbi:MAG: hypothetical protein LQ350_002063 [Teloschistes chrysophthalmus]|nr:MAG: hypothetical protein LQ350_002063 [Niorma chrysophthalma]